MAAISQLLGGRSSLFWSVLRKRANYYVWPFSHSVGIIYIRFHFFFFFFAHFHFPASGQAVVTDVIPSPPRCLPSIFIAHRVQQSHCSSIVHRMLLTHALALSASQFVHKKKSQRIYTGMYAPGGARTHATDLYQARGQPDTPPGRPFMCHTDYCCIPRSFGPPVVRACFRRSRCYGRHTYIL